MPDDANGNYSLPPGYLGVTGQTILPSEHNPPLEDIANAMTARLSRSGVAPMTGPVKTITGSAAFPAIYPNSNPSIGIYWTSTGIGFAGTVSGARFIGELIPYTFLTALPLTVIPNGQTLLRASYPTLWGVAQTDIAAGNTFYNNGDGSTTFGIGDVRGRVMAGWEASSGATGRLSTAGGGIDGTVLGAAGGDQTITLTTDQIPSHLHGNTLADPGHAHGYTQGDAGPTGTSGFGTNPPPSGYGRFFPSTTSPSSTGISITNASAGGGGAHKNVQPTLVCNYLLYVGA